MKKMLFSLLIFWLLNATVLIADDIKISYFVTYPHIIYDSKTHEISGSLYEFLQDHIAPAMGSKFVWAKSPGPVPRQFASLSNNTIDASALLAFSPDRAKQFSYSKKHFYEGFSGIAVKEDSSITQVKKVDDILGIKIGYANKTFVSPFMRDKRIQFDMVGSSNFLELNIRKLLVGRIQAAYSPDLASMLYLEKSMGLEGQLRTLKLPEPPGKFHVVFSKKASDKAVRFDKAFEEVGGAKLYLKLLGKYLDTSKL